MTTSRAQELLPCLRAGNFTADDVGWPIRLQEALERVIELENGLQRILDMDVADIKVVCMVREILKPIELDPGTYDTGTYDTATYDEERTLHI